MKPILHKDARITVEKLVDGDKHYYFGYYGKSPWSHDGRYVVALEVDFIDRFKDESESANIILIDVKTKKKKVLAKTRAWNWQQGAMMQWMPSKHKENRLIYNDIKDGVFISRIIDVDSGKEDIIPYPIYDVHPKGRYATSLSFEKLEHVRRGYGYPGGEKDRFDKPIAEKEGVYLIDLEKKRRALIISLEELYNHKKLSTMDSGYHWIDQPAFNTDGTRICFLHRWKIDGGLFPVSYTHLTLPTK